MSETPQTPQTVYAEPTLIGIIRLGTVERGRDIHEDVEIDNPFMLICGDHTSLAVRNAPWGKNINIITDPERDYYLFELAYDGITYTFGPGDAVLVYANGAVKGIVGQSNENLKAIFEVLTHANRPENPTP